MGISSIVSSAYKAMPSIKTVKRALKTVPDIIFDKGADTFVRGTADSFKAAMKNGGSIKKSLWQSIKEGGGKLAIDVAKNTSKLVPTANLSYSAINGKQQYMTNGKVVDITMAYLSHPYAIHAGANPTDDVVYDLSNSKDGNKIY